MNKTEAISSNSVINQAFIYARKIDSQEKSNYEERLTNLFETIEIIKKGPPLGAIQIPGFPTPTRVTKICGTTNVALELKNISEKIFSELTRKDDACWGDLSKARGLAKAEIDSLDDILKESVEIEQKNALRELLDDVSIAEIHKLINHCQENRISLTPSLIYDFMVNLRDEEGEKTIVPETISQSQFIETLVDFEENQQKLDVLYTIGGIGSIARAPSRGETLLFIEFVKTDVPVQERIYIQSNPASLHLLSKLLISEMFQSSSDVQSIKISGPEYAQRRDNIVIYLNTDSPDRTVKHLLAIQEKYPDYFGSSPMLFKKMHGSSIGTCNGLGRNHSFHDLLSKAISVAASDINDLTAWRSRVINWFFLYEKQEEVENGASPGCSIT